MASQQGTVRPRFPLASLPPPAAPPSNRVLPPRPSFNIRPPTLFDQTFRLPIAQPPPPPPPPPKPKPLSAPNSPLPNSQVIIPKLISPTPTQPPSPFQAPLAVSTTAPTTPTTPTPLSISLTKSPKTSSISHPPSPPRENKKVSDSKSLGGVKKKIITLAGDNKEVIVELTPSRKKGISISDELEGNYPVVAVLVNSNVQGVNNSILRKSYLSHHNPGVHLISHHVYTNPNSGTNE